MASKHKIPVSRYSRFLILIVLLVVGLLFVRGNYTSETDKEGRGDLVSDYDQGDIEMKQYIDPIYNFSIKYRSTMPPRLSRTEYDGTDYHVIFSSRANAQNPIQGESFADSIEIRVYPNPSRMSSLEFVKKGAFKNDLPQWNNTSRPTTRVNLDNIDGVIIDEVIGGAGPYGPVAFIYAEENIIEVKAGNLSSTNKEIFNAMLSSFSFTD